MLEDWAPMQPNPLEEDPGEIAHAEQTVTGSLAYIKKALKERSEKRKASARFDAGAKAQAKSKVTKVLFRAGHGIGTELSAKHLIPEASPGSFLIPAWVASVPSSH